MIFHREAGAHSVLLFRRHRGSVALWSGKYFSVLIVDSPERSGGKSEGGWRIS